MSQTCTDGATSTLADAVFRMGKPMRRAMLHMEVDTRRRVERLRDAARTAPTGVMEATGVVYVFRHDDVRQLLHDQRLTEVGFAALDLLDVADEPLRSWYGALLSTTTGLTDHRHRHLVATAFGTISAERIRHRAALSASAAIAPLLGDGGDLVAALHMVPVAVMCEVLGIPAALVPAFAAWVDDLGPVFGMLTSDQVAPAMAAFDPLITYIGEVVADREHSPQDDLISALIHAEIDGDVLTRAETIATVLLLLASGHDATGSQIGCSLFTLLQRNDIVRLAIAEPDLVPSIVAETIRLEPCADGVPRRVAAPLDICGEPQAVGSLVVLCTLTAHRDPSAWTDADELRPRRFMTAATPELLTFGAGAHHCLGAALARVTLTEAIRATIAHMPILLVDPDEIRWTTTVGRCPEILPVMM